MSEKQQARLETGALDQPERERLAVMCAAKAARAESEAGDCRRDIADESMSDYHRGLAKECLPEYEREAADWRTIAAIVRRAPSGEPEGLSDYARAGWRDAMAQSNTPELPTPPRAPQEGTK